MLQILCIDVDLIGKILLKIAIHNKNMKMVDLFLQHDSSDELSTEANYQNEIIKYCNDNDMKNVCNGWILIENCDY